MKYLEKIGVKLDYSVDSRLFPKDENGDRDARFKEQRELYGFDERETWDLGYTSACWLYQHISLYKDIGSQVIDFSFHKIKVSGVELTQEEIINQIIELLEGYLKYENKSGISESFTDDEEAKYLNDLCKAFELYSKIVPMMWW